MSSKCHPSELVNRSAPIITGSPALQSHLISTLHSQLAVAYGKTLIQNHCTWACPCVFTIHDHLSKDSKPTATWLQKTSTKLRKKKRNPKEMLIPRSKGGISCGRHGPSPIPTIPGLPHHRFAPNEANAARGGLSGIHLPGGPGRRRRRRRRRRRFHTARGWMDL